MGKIWLILIAISIFLSITFLYWKLTSGYAKKEVGKKGWKQWVTRTYYWQGAIMFSGAATVGVIFLLQQVNVLTF